jgi:CHASE2 domain-containing sensor protein
LIGDLNIVYVAIGVVAVVGGLAMLSRAIRSGPGENPKATAMLIAGMMITAFGLLMAGFAIGFATSEPLDLNDAETAS